MVLSYINVLSIEGSSHLIFYKIRQACDFFFYLLILAVLTLQLNKANASDAKDPFLDLHLSISNDIVSTKIYDKHDDFDFEVVNFPFLDSPCILWSICLSARSFC